MKRIYNIILFALLSSVVFAHEGHQHGNPLEGLTKVNITNLSIPQTGNFSFSIAALYTASNVKSTQTASSTEGHDIVTYTGWFKDRHCTWSLTPNSVLTGSCSVACGTGGPTGQSMLAVCQAYGHGIWLNPTGDGTNDGEFLGFDAESAELLKAFLLQ
ncbi:MAG: hypothetical protein LBT25_02355, partial [Candidatus Symbiothrix sp.]|nr:hypothetical protein [Candidatus Symbiothrix sp.]